MSPLSEEFSASGPGGFAATARGMLTPIILIIGLGFGVSIYFLNNTAAASRDEHRRLDTSVGRMADGIEVQNWLLSMPQEKRPKLLRPFSATRFIETENTTR